MFVVLGVSGNTGSVVAQNLLDRGQPVRVIVRSEEKGTIWKEKGAEVAVADIMDIAAMTNALFGADGAYFLLPPDLENEKYLDQSIERANAIVDAARAARLPSFSLL
jgi:uncharacterized protein YbjT (DUF2867 family)